MRDSEVWLVAFHGALAGGMSLIAAQLAADEAVELYRRRFGDEEGEN